MLQSFWSLIRFLVNQEKGKAAYNKALVYIVLAKIFSILAPLAVAHSIKVAITPNNWVVAGGFLGAYLVCRWTSGILLYQFEKTMAAAALNSAQSLLVKFFRYFLVNPQDAKPAEIAGTEIGRFRTVIYAFYFFAIKHLFPVLLEIVFSSILLTLILGPAYSAIMVLTCTVFFTVNYYWNKRLNSLIPERDRRHDHAQMKAIEALRNKAKIHQAGAEKLEEENFRASSAEFERAYLETTITHSKADLCQSSVAFSGIGAMLGLAIYQVHQGLLGMDGLVLVLALSTQALSPLTNIAYAFTGLLNALPQMLYLKTTIMAGLAIEHPEEQPRRATGFSMHNVCVVLGRGEQTFTLKDIKLSVGQGEKVVLVGPSGSGKSTMVKSLIGLHRNLSGQTVWTDSSGNMPDDSWRSHFVFVPQKEEFIGHSLAYNLFYGLVDGRGKEKDFYQTHKQQIDHIVLTTGLQAVIDRQEGQLGLVDANIANLSGGERQKLSLTNAVLRAIFLGRDIVVFDEFSSAIDMEEEARITREVIFGLLAQKTVITITHRIELARLYDNIVVLASGQIETMGTHANLMDGNGFYARALRA